MANSQIKRLGQFAYLQMAAEAYLVFVVKPPRLSIHAHFGVVVRDEDGQESAMRPPMLFCLEDCRIAPASLATRYSKRF